MPPQHERLQERLAGLAILLCCLVLLNEPWVRANPLRAALAQLLVTLPLALGLWLEWRGGLLSVPLRQLFQQMTQRRRQMRPVVNLLQTMASVLMLLVLYRLHGA